MKILLLDEDKATYEVLRDVAQLSGSEVIQITSLKEVKNYLKTHNDVDAIIAEQKLGEHPTWELIQFMKNENIIEIPFVILTSSLSKDEKDFYTFAGVTAMFEKPFNPLEVFTAVVEYLKEKKGEEYVKEHLEEEKVDKNSLKKVIEELIDFLKSLFLRK